MTKTLPVIAAVVILALGSFSAAPRTAQNSREDHVTWVAETLKKMQTIKVGMTRAELLRVFTTEGGLSTTSQRTYVSRDCPYFKVNVRFEPVGTARRDADGNVFRDENDRDRIVSISQPYLQFSIAD